MTQNASPMRWHCYPLQALRDSCDTIEGHQIRVEALCRNLSFYIGHDLSNSDLLYAARNHDEAERVLGDIPGPAKDRFPNLAKAYQESEVLVLAEMGHSWALTEKEQFMLKLCDKVDAYIWARAFGARGGEWETARDKLFEVARDIGEDCVEWLREQLNLWVNE